MNARFCVPRFSCLALALTSLVLSACGDPFAASRKIPELMLRHTVPSRSNFERWSKSWDQKSWIVAIAPGHDAIQTREDLLRSVVRSALHRFDLPEGSAAFATVGSMLAQHIVTELLDVGGPVMPSTTGQVPSDDGIGKFGFVTFSRPRDMWNVLRDSAGLQAFLPFEFTGVERAFDAWRVLESTPGILWAEPDLESEYLQSESGNEFKSPNEFENPQAVQTNVLKQVKWVEAMQYAWSKGVREPKEIVVAVIDTGVDFKHPDLVGRMFENPLEKNGKPGEDDDGNGYTDDLHGIDATIPKNGVDRFADPDPGVADINGAGKACPTVSAEFQAELPGVRFECGHGTHVAGIIAARHNNGDSTLGVCPSCKILALRVARRCVEPDSYVQGTCVFPLKPVDPVKQVERNAKIQDSAQARALAYILGLTTPDKRNVYVNIVNLSIGKYFYSRSLRSLTSKLRANQIIVVSAVGNNGTDTPMFPAAYDSVLSVCATSQSRDGGGRGEFAKAGFSNFGDWVDICAPGESILSTAPGTVAGDDKQGNTEIQNGTSQASPLVAGAAGLIRALKPEMGAEEVIRALLRSANFQDVYADPMNVHFGEVIADRPLYLLGTGKLDIEASLKGERVSNAYLEIEKGYTQQIAQRGCVVRGSTARAAVLGQPAPESPLWDILTSLPAMLALFWFSIRLARVWRA